MLLAPDPGMHAPHRGAHYEPGVIDTKAAGQQSEFGGHHVRIPVAREMGMQPIARLTGFTVPDAIGNHYEKLRRIERLAGTEQLTCKSRLQKAVAAAPGTMVDEHGVAHHALCIADGVTERVVVNSQLGNSFTGGEGEILDDVVALRRRGICRGLGGRRRRRCQERRYGECSEKTRQVLEDTHRWRLRGQGAHFSRSFVGGPDEPPWTPEGG